MKKQLPTHDDTPSVPLPPKKVKVKAVNYEGVKRQTKYEVEEYDAPHTDTQPKVKYEPRNDDYPFDDIDIYAVDTRIWDRIGEMGGEGGGPHTHDNYATKTELTDGLATKSDDPHTHSEYADAQTLADHLANHPSGGDGGSYDDTEVRGLIQDNATAIQGKADDPHTHTEYQPSGDYATNTDLSNGLAGKSDTGHDHTQYVKGEGATGLAMWIGSQADYDAIVSKRLTTLYVVM